MNFGKSRKSRKSLFVTATILCGRFFKNDEEGGGSTGSNEIEVSPGFANSGTFEDPSIPDDPKEPKTPPTNEPEGNDGNDEGNDEGNDDGKPKKKERGTAQYVRDLKRELREERAARAQMEARIQKIENGGLQQNPGPDSNTDTSAKPNPDDGKKYPLGVLDDGYITDMIEWTADQKVRQSLEGQRRAEAAKAEQAKAEKHQATLREKVGELTNVGSELFDDFEEVVLEAGLRGEWELTETTFTAAAEADNGAAILYALSQDPEEAQRVSEMSAFQQLKYIAQKDGEFEAKKPKSRNKPAAERPPSNAPRGLNGSSPIRADTENLDDFRKLYYQR